MFVSTTSPLKKLSTSVFTSIHKDKQENVSVFFNGEGYPTTHSALSTKSKYEL